jgi:ABC-type antimicrobial peptide transport system permease subunit
MAGLGIDPRQQSMKIALLALLGSILGALGGAAIGIVAGIGWVEIFETMNSDATLVFFTFMPIGAVVGAAAGAILFGVIAARDVEIPTTREPAGRRDS